ncbi:MAG: response regulator [Burkholderiaceae bacterium]|nr:response regulator [Burkholderiaceae bacterium]
MNALKNERSSKSVTDDKTVPPASRQQQLPLQLELDICQQTVNAQNHSSDQLRRLSNYLMYVCDEERQRLANEIHDTLGQNLLALKIDVSMLHARTRKNHPRINHRAAIMMEHLDVAVANVREIINNLYPPVLKLGLLASVEWKVGEFEKRHPIACTLQVDGHDTDYAPYDGYSMPMIRILHESLKNVARHASANCVNVALSGVPRRLTMQVVDDGVGIHPDHLCKDGAYGLVWIRERIGALGGEFTIGTNARQKGTMLTVSLPGRASA